MSSPLSPDDVARIARLARLALTPDEMSLYARQLADILAYVQQLDAVDTSDVPPTSHPLALTAPLRDDDVRPSLAREAALAAAPEADPRGGLFKVPRVIGA